MGHSVDISGLNNYVVDKITQVQIYENTETIDQSAFRAALERIRDQKTMDQQSLDLVEAFLRVWNRKKVGSNGL